MGALRWSVKNSTRPLLPSWISTSKRSLGSRPMMNPLATLASGNRG